MLLADAAARTALGPLHPVHAAFKCKLAYLFSVEDSHKEASELLLAALAVYDAMAATTDSRGGRHFASLSQEGGSIIENNTGGTSVSLANDTIECLYNLSVSLFKCGEIDLALHCGSRCVELSSKIYRTYPPNTLISCLLYMCDMFVEKCEFDSAFEVMQEAWLALRQRPYNGRVAAAWPWTPSQQQQQHLPSSRTTHILRNVSDSSGGSAVSGQQQPPYVSSRGVGVTLMRVASRAVEIFLRTLPMQTRSLLESVSAEVECGKLACPVDEKLWAAACSLVTRAIWQMQPNQYFALVVKGLQDEEMAGMRGTKNSVIVKRVSFLLTMSLL